MTAVGDEIPNKSRLMYCGVRDCLQQVRTEVALRDAQLSTPGFENFWRLCSGHRREVIRELRLVARKYGLRIVIFDRMPHRSMR
jgi:hypothetical protein